MQGLLLHSGHFGHFESSHGGQHLHLGSTHLHGKTPHCLQQ